MHDLGFYNHLNCIDVSVICNFEFNISNFSFFINVNSIIKKIANDFYYNTQF